MISQLSCGFKVVVVRNEREVEAGGAHLSKTTKGGAASSVTAQRSASPHAVHYTLFHFSLQLVADDKADGSIPRGLSGARYLFYYIAPFR